MNEELKQLAQAFEISNQQCEVILRAVGEALGKEKHLDDLTKSLGVKERGPNAFLWYFLGVVIGSKELVAQIRLITSKTPADSTAGQLSASLEALFKKLGHE